ncbi:MAG: Chromatin structure-remodeling complex protein rsc9 [Alyxoria varia]|nr:MAG: Chromatin structure-remodeling complex protein rsc9 [Alyxoria varia]
MAPNRLERNRAPSIEPTDEYNEFIKRLQEFHDKRGTTFEPQPKVGLHRVDLLALYKRVTRDGGYDKVSDTKSFKLAWRKVGQEFRLSNYNLPTLAFSLKTVYYKYLAAFEIVDIHKKEPPPKEILEDVSAKGGDLLNRTVENFQKPVSRVQANGVHEESPDPEGDETPKKEKEESEDPGSTGGRATRGLRQAPPQRQLFRADVLTKPSKQQGEKTHSPVPVRQGTPNNTQTNHVQPNHTPAATAPAPIIPTTRTMYGPEEATSALASYEPKPHLPLTLKPVMTPANNYESFKAEQKRIRDVELAKSGRAPPKDNGMLLPGHGFFGPNIYGRTLNALASGVLDEQEYALNHLVKISYERWEKYSFNSFPGLVEALVRVILEVGPLINGIRIDLSFEDDGSLHGERLVSRGFNGSRTSGITTGQKRKLHDMLEPEDAARRLKLVNEAGLVLRNMVMLEGNADFLANRPVIYEVIITLLNLPYYPEIAEIQGYALEIAEQLTQYFSDDRDDALFWSLFKFLDSNERGSILTAMRAICRMGAREGQPVNLQHAPLRILRRLCEWMLVEDEELRIASLDLIYLYTAVPENVEKLLQETDVESLIRQLVRLLLYGAREEEKKEILQTEQPAIPEPPTPEAPAPKSSTDYGIPIIPTDLVEQLLGYDEPERSSQWLRACFEEDTKGEITQIALWQAYQIPFAKFAAQRPLLPAKDFITNVSNTFATASAQALPGAQMRFVIQGIRARKSPVNTKGQVYMRCLWHLDSVDPTTGSVTSSEKECGAFAPWPKTMWEHVVREHLGIGKGEDGKYNFAGVAGAPSLPQTTKCRWAGCKRFDREPCTPFAVGMHMKTHLPDSSDRSYHRSKHNVSATASGHAHPTAAASHQQSRPGTASATSASSKNPPGTPVTHGSGAQAQAPQGQQQKTQSQTQTQTTLTRTYHVKNTAVDERNDAAGLPLSAVLVLRNLARGIPKTKQAVQEREERERKRRKTEQAGASREHGVGDAMDVDSGSGSRDTNGDVAASRRGSSDDNVNGTPTSGIGQADVDGVRKETQMWRYFPPSVREQVFHVLAYNRSLGEYLMGVVEALEKGTLD